MKLATGNKNPFRVEDFRDYLARKRKYKELRKTYTFKFPEVRDNNTKPFWNKKMVTLGEELEGSSIYQDKIGIVSKYLFGKKGKLLDIGFGWGNLEKKIQKFPELEIAGIDLSEEAVKAAKKKLRGEFKIANIFDTPFKTGEFDIVVILDVIEHIRPSKVFDAYKEINRVLKKGGTLVISVPVNEGLEETINKGMNPGGHLRVYTEDLLKAELKLAGFRVLKVVYRTAFLRLYKLKSMLIKYVPFRMREPNQMIMFAQKQ